MPHHSSSTSSKKSETSKTRFESVIILLPIRNVPPSNAALDARCPKWALPFHFCPSWRIFGQCFKFRQGRFLDISFQFTNHSTVRCCFMSPDIYTQTERSETSRSSSYSICHILKTLHIALAVVLHDFTIITINSDYFSININRLAVIM